MSSPNDSQFSPLSPPGSPRVQLTIFSGTGTGQSVDLRRSVSLLGTRPGCKIALRQTEVQPVHCAIVNTGEAVYLRDLISKSGTFLNGLRAECESLTDGDIIRIADWELAVEIRQPELNSSTGSSVVNLEPSPTVLALKDCNGGLLVKLARGINVIGRKAAADFIVHDRQVSRAHALIFLLNGQPVVCDLLSENHLLINGEKTRFGVIHSGDLLELGTSRVRVVIPSPTLQVPSSNDGSSVSAAERMLKTDQEQSDLIDIRTAELDHE